MSYYPIELDKARNFKYGMRAIDLIEKKFKKPIGKLDLNNMYMEELATIIWGGLVHEDKNLSVNRVMEIVDNSDITITELSDIAGDLISKAFGGDEPEEEVKNE